MDSKYEFMPDQELLDFAKEFSDNYKEFSIGDYFSCNNKYKISYLEKIDNSYTPARSYHYERTISLSKSVLFNDSISRNFVFYLILWCTIKFDTLDFYMCDKIAMDFYLKISMPKRDILLGIISLLPVNKMNIKRISLLETYEKDSKI